MALNRSLGLSMLTFYGTGMILGAGIYSIIGQAAGMAGDSLWQGFAIAAIAALLTALSYAELATMFPTAGGEYIYLRNAFSKQRWMAAAVGMTITFAGCASVATVALAFASYLQNFMDWPRSLVAFGLLVVFTGVNIVGIKQSSWINAIFTVIEAFGLILFIWLGWQKPEFGAALSASPTLATVSSAALIIFAYLGFENIVSLVEETREPEKNIPRAILLSLLITTVLYILVSFAAIALMPPEQLALTDSALASAAMMSSTRVASLLGGIALFSTANTVLIGLIATSRILYGISKDASLPQIFSKTLISQKTPWVAAMVVLILSSILLPVNKVKTLASLASFSTMIAFMAVNIALITLRFTQPHKERPFRVPFSLGKVPILPGLGVLVCLIFSFQFDFQVYLISFIIFVCSVGIYFFSQNLKDRRYR